MRDGIDDLSRIHVRNASGEMVPLSALLKPETIFRAAIS